MMVWLLTQQTDLLQGHNADASSHKFPDQNTGRSRSREGPNIPGPNPALRGGITLYWAAVIACLTHLAGGKPECTLHVDPHDQRCSIEDVLRQFIENSLAKCIPPTSRQKIMG